MKNNLILIITICFIQFAEAQIDSINLKSKQVQEINTVFKNYLNDIQKEPKDWDKIVSYTHPSYFNLMSKELMIDKLKKSFKKSGILQFYRFNGIA